MVLYKRKPVPYPAPLPLPENLNVRVWYIPHTREWFLQYDEYLKRLDYYNTRKFVCEITGNSCLTFFEAHESELKEMALVESNFPENLKEPILRHLQFSTVPRIDQLVDEVYSTFKNDYYPGETVMIRLNDYKNDFKTRCIIREKAKFNAVQTSTGFRPSYCQYRVSRVDNGMEVVVDENQITRDRNNFTKWFVKTFIKLTVSRSPKIGAPWIVKQKYASKYRIPTEYPSHLLHFKEKEQQKKPNAKANPKENKQNSKANSNTETKLKNIAPLPSKSKSTTQAKATHHKESSPVPPPKKVIDDLLHPLVFSAQKPLPKTLEEFDGPVQEALECWAFLNVYRVPLVLDTFTFDDFITAIKWNSLTKRCFLLDEIFCSVLTVFMKEDSQELALPLPEDLDFSDYESDDEIQLGRKSDPAGDGDDEDTRKDKAINGSKTAQDGNHKDSKKESKEDSEQQEITEGSDGDNDEESDEDEEDNLVESYLNYRGVSWQQRLQKRNFKDGNWQIIFLGILDLVKDLKEYRDDIKIIFDTLAPSQSSVSPNSILSQFLRDLSITSRLKGLSILCSLLMNSQLIRQYLDQCIDESAQLRRERLEKLREYKVAFEKAQDADKEYRQIVGATDAPGAESNKATEKETESKKRRRRAEKLSKEPTEEELKISKENPKAGILLATRTANLKLSEEIRYQRRELEKKIAERDIQRIRYLGKDRHFNRYWWFENNGLPNLGRGRRNVEENEDDNDDDDDDDDDTDDDDDEEFATDTYLMGKLWVQGPILNELKLIGISESLSKKWNEAIKQDGNDDQEATSKNSEEIKSETGADENETLDEIKDFKDLPPKFIEASAEVFDIAFDSSNKTIKTSSDNRTLVDEYGATASDITFQQRKVIEEHPDPLLSPNDWRYFDKAEDIDGLMKWLNPWGQREHKLLKELESVKDKIVSSIKSRRKALKLDAISPEEESLIKTLDDIVISETESEDSSSEGEDQSDYSIEMTPESSSPEANQSTSEIPRTRRSIAEAEKLAEERRRKEAEIEAKRNRSKPSARIAKREQKRRKLKEHRAKRKLRATTLQKLESYRENKELNRCMEWVNQSALEKLGHTHYEGVKKTRATEKPRRGKRQ